MQVKQIRGSFSKRFLAFAMALIMAIGAIGFSGVRAYASLPQTRVMILGHFVDFEGTQPIHESGRVLVPIRGVFTLMGFEPVWNQATQTATLFDGEILITVTVGQSTLTAGNQVIPLDVPARNIGGRIMIPLRAVTEAIGGTPNWDNANRIAVITPPTAMIPRTQANINAITGNNVGLPSVTTATLPNARTGQAYNQTLAAIGITPITWSVISGALPAGLSLNATTGAITGTPTTTGTSNFTVLAQNAVGSASRALTLVVEAGTLPNRRLTQEERNAWIADYRARGGATAVELEVIRLINIERANHGLVQVARDDYLMMAARLFAQQANDLRGLYTGTHNFGPYATNANATHGASANVAASFGTTLRWNGGNWHSSGTASAADLVSGWMASTEHRNYILSPEHRFIGIGQFPGGISYLFLNDTASVGQGQFTVTFNANGGTGTMQNQTFTAGVAQNLNNNVFTRQGWTFVGWSTSPTGNVQHGNGENMILTANRNLYAIWTQGNVVTFNANGGTGTTLPQVFQNNVAQNLRTNSFTRQGFTFAGWSTSATGAVVYNNGQSITNNTTRTLFAVWTQGATITFNNNGGTGTMTNQVFQPNVAQNLTNNAFTRSGWTFAGWSTSASGTVVYNNGQSITNNTNRTLFAVWTQGTVVTFNANGGTGTMPNQVFQNNVAQNLSNNAFTRTGFTFAGWSTSATGAVVYNNGQSITNTATRTLFAVWTQGTTVTFNANGGTGTMPNQIFQPNVAQNLNNNTFTRAGFTFAGWSTSASGSVVYNNGQSITNNTNRTLFAVWTQGTTVTFNANGGTGTMPNQIFQPNVAQNLSNNAFTRTGFTFAGWSTSASGAVEFTNGQSIINNTNRTLFAVWTQATTVTFNANSGTGTMPAQTFQTNVAQNLNNNTFTRAGFTFAGWSTSASGSVVYTNGQSIINNTNRTLFAVWTPANAVVPDVVGQTLAAATSTLSSAPGNFGIAQGPAQHHAIIPAGSVISQTPAAGSQLTPGSPVTVILSLGPALVINNPGPQTATIGMQFDFQMTHSIGAAPTTWSAADLPDGLSISSTGLISGTPTAAAVTSTVTVTATNAAGSHQVTFTITVS
ncbi:MAG: InlB B-repeat-containing protein [Defluviitaleaceae bacterium]|nr:InlB B-repeat-containing protein [Defluviitaleaceae bacterium]